MSEKAVFFGLLIGFMTAVVVTHPPGYRCQYKQECVAIRLF